MKKSIVVQIASMLFLITVGCSNNDKKTNDMETQTKSEVAYLNPEGLHKNPAYSQLVVTKGAMKTIYIGGQNATNKEGQVVGKGDIKAQAVQTLNNLKIALAAGEA
jgi:enamine deaminase RidA (YjgF/YER057c/UK114 family)